MGKIYKPLQLKRLKRVKDNPFICDYDNSKLQIDEIRNRSK